MAIDYGVILQQDLVNSTVQQLDVERFCFQVPLLVADKLLARKCEFDEPVRTKTLETLQKLVNCEISIMVIMPAFQAGYVSSILISRSK